MVPIEQIYAGRKRRKLLPPCVTADADLVLTGEGKFDSQNLRGKVVIGVAHRAKKISVPGTVLAGTTETNIAEV